MKYPILIGILILSLIPLYNYASPEDVGEGNLVVNCGPLSGNFTLDCINKIPEIDPAFLDRTTQLNSDQDKFEELGGVISNPCNAVIITVADDIVGDDPNDCMDDFEVIRTYTITDGTTTVECISNYLIEFAPLRVLSFPQPTIVECAENIDSLITIWFNDIGGTNLQGCGNIVSANPSVPLVSFNTTCDPSSSNPNERGQVRVLWNLEDDCGNETMGIASFIVVDNTPPVLICPDDRTFDIENTDLIADIESYLESTVAVEDCGMAIPTNDFDMSRVTFDCQVQEILVSASAEDLCTNVGTCQVTISIENNAVPNINCPSDITIECGDPTNALTVAGWLQGASALDFLQTQLPVSNNFDPSLLDATFCGQSTEITFNSIFCGRMSSCLGNITIEDTQKPVIQCPNDTTYFSSEPDIIGAAGLWVSEFEAQDACGLTFIENDLDTLELLFSCDQIKEIMVTFSAEDECQNDTTCIRQLTIESDYSSTIDCSSFLQLQCGNPNNLMLIQDWLSLTTASDNINSVIPVIADLNLSDPRLLSCSGTIPVTFTATDLCNFQLSCPSFIMMIDAEAPTISCPDDITFDVDVTDLNLEIDNWLGSVIADDNCAPPIVTTDYDPSSIQGCDLIAIVPVMFTAADSCGLSANCERVLTINTDRLPTINCADQLLINCNDMDNDAEIDTWLRSTTGQDFNGIDLVVENNFIPGNLLFNQCADSLEVQFRIIDNCLFEDSCVSMIMLADTIAPEIICPTPISFNSTELDYQAALESWVMSASSTDMCMPGITSTDFDPLLFDLCSADEIVTVTFTASDGCNNTSTCTSDINVNIAQPEINCPVNDLFLQCGDPDNDVTIENWLAIATGADNNLNALTVSSDFNENSLIGDCSISSVVTFSVIDTCGQINNCTRVISLVDDRGPNIDCPPALNLSAGSPGINQTVEDFLANIQIEDCNTFDRSDDLDRTLLDFMCGDELVIPVTVTAIDSCSNTSNCNFDITIRNSVVSAINCAQDTIVECGNPDNEINLRQWLESATAFDSDGNQFLVTNDFNPNDPDIVSCSGSIPVMFVMMDNCNMSLSCNATVTITDTTPPTITCPADTVLVEGMAAFDQDLEAWLSSASGADNCRTIDIDENFDENYTIDICLGSLDNVVTFTAQDECGLTEDCNAVLTIRSESSAVVTCPDAIVIECGDSDNVSLIEDWMSRAEGTDFDGTNLPVITPNFNSSEVMGLTCLDTLQVMFRITNSCNTDIECGSIITAEDTTPPMLTCPDDFTVNATNPNAEQEIMAWLDTSISADECTAVDVSFDMNIDFTQLCQSADLIEVAYLAEDACGLTSSCSAVIFVNKDAPTINCPANDLVIACGDNNIQMLIDDWLSTASASDNNGAAIDIIDGFNGLDMTDICLSDNEISFSSVDACGQVVDCFSNVIVTDETEPEIVCPNDIDIDIFSTTIQIELDDWLGSVSATDECSLVSVSDNFSSDINNLDCGQSIEVQFSVADECNNTNDCRSSVSFINNLEVRITCPDPISIKCSEIFLTSRIDSFLSSYIVESQDVFDVINDFNPDNIDGNCTQSFIETVNFTIIDACGNTDDCSQDISLVPDGKIYVPNTISPNDDGRDDFFTIFGNETITNIKSLRIYNRYGNLVFDGENLTPNVEREGWNGFYQSDLGNSNVYLFTAEVEDAFGNIFYEKGSITVIK